MLSVILASLDDERTLVRALAPLVPAAADGIVRDVVLADAGSRDATLEIAEAAGCVLVKAGPDRAGRLRAGARAARADWLVFLRPDVVLDEGWHGEAARFVAEAARAEGLHAAAFTHACEAAGAGARAGEGWALLASRALGRPRGEQGLVVSRRLYDALGGHRPARGHAERDLARRIGRRRLRLLKARATLLAPPRENGGM